MSHTVVAYLAVARLSPQALPDTRTMFSDPVAVGAISLYKDPHLSPEGRHFLKRSQPRAHEARVEPRFSAGGGKRGVRGVQTPGRCGVRVESNLDRVGVWRPNGVQIKRPQVYETTRDCFVSD